MNEPRQRVTWWTALVLAIACPLTWLSTAWHLAVEDHDHHELASDDHDHGRDHDHDAPDHDAPADEGHRASDHQLPTCTRPTAQALVVPFVPTERVAFVLPAGVVSLVEPPPDEIAPATDPPLDASRPRAPPVG